MSGLIFVVAVFVLSLIVMNLDNNSRSKQDEEEYRLLKRLYRQEYQRWYDEDGK